MIQNITNSLNDQDLALRIASRFNLPCAVVPQNGSQSEDAKATAQAPQVLRASLIVVKSKQQPQCSSNDIGFYDPHMWLIFVLHSNLAFLRLPAHSGCNLMSNQLSNTFYTGQTYNGPEHQCQ